MFIINQYGRVVGLPENMEESGFKQAAEVLSISDSLMSNGNYTSETGQGGVLISKSGNKLRDEILSKFPKVMRDSEYLAKVSEEKQKKEVVAEVKPEVKLEVKKNVAKLGRPKKTK